jgi:hypothetical protein
MPRIPPLPVPFQSRAAEVKVDYAQFGNVCHQSFSYWDVVGMLQITRKGTTIGQCHQDAVREPAGPVCVAGAAFNGEDLRNQVSEGTNSGHVMFDSLFIDAFLESPAM